ncbi:LCP family protein [Anaerotignum sp.]|nr:LCP family protein [Anaerotignum sp.]MBQ7758319.1 LCP family protein [Anaerotignum sp.]MBQ7759478.1 LCP family protein [Anaerotignum sp.]
MGEKREYRRRRRPYDDMDMELRQRQVRRRQTRTPYPEEQQRVVYEEQTYIDPRRVAQGRRMSRRKAEQKKRRRRSILIVIALILLLIGAYAAAKVWVMMDKWDSKAENSDFVVSTSDQEKVEEIINVAIFGTDEDGFRADVNMVASFNTKTKDLHFISVPRDTRVTMTDDMIQYLEDNDAYVPNRNGVYGQCKLTEVHAYAGNDNRCTFSVTMLEDLLDIKIDYYVKVDLSAFREIVDAVGGVDFNVEDRLYYVDPYQDLYIDLYPGTQHLDGEKAEQLVRFREGYAQKDLKRIEVQQQFIQALIEKVCSSETLMNNLDDLVKVALDCTESNISVSEALKYVKYVKDLDPAKITSDTVPGEGGSYYDIDEEGLKELIDWRIHGIEPVEDVQMNDDELTTNE